MDPGTGRFLSRDNWAEDYNSPMSLNKWMYVEGNPVNYVDPSGKIPFLPAPSNAPKASTTLVTRQYLYFNRNVIFINGLRLHKTVVAAAIASQTAHPNLNDVYDKNQPADSSSSGLGPSATNTSQIYNKNNGYIKLIEQTAENLGWDVAKYLPCFPEEKNWNPYNWDHAIQTMTLRLAASTIYCPNCHARDRLIIAGMAHNGPGFAWLPINSKTYGNDKNHKSTSKIDWTTYFDEHSQSKIEDNAPNAKEKARNL